MIFITADLDRTCIFSKKTYSRNDQSAVCIEYLKGKPQSFVSNAMLQKLAKINETCYFVPVTTRSREQFERLTLFKKESLPKWIIMSNGGIVLKDGEVVKEWQSHIAQLYSEVAKLESIQQLIGAFLPIDTWKNKDDLFFVAKCEQTHFEDQLATVLKEIKWCLHRNGNKLYVMPEFLTKENAVHYVKSQVECSNHIAMGDSLMDKNMLDLADYSFVPAHGELNTEDNKNVVPLSGIHYTEYCFDVILKLSLDQN